MGIGFSLYSDPGNICQDVIRILFGGCAGLEGPGTSTLDEAKHGRAFHCKGAVSTSQ